MERQLPLVDVNGTAFYLDVVREELRQKGNEGNRISFNVFELDGNGYTFLYDTLLRCAVEDKDAITENDGRYRWVTLRALMELDPEGIAIKYGIPLEVLCPDETGRNGKNIIEEEDEEEDEDSDSFY